jgi:hypothetical protein
MVKIPGHIQVLGACHAGRRGARCCASAAGVEPGAFFNLFPSVKGFPCRPLAQEKTKVRRKKAKVLLCGKLFAPSAAQIHLTGKAYERLGGCLRRKNKSSAAE